MHGSLLIPSVLMTQIRESLSLDLVAAGLIVTIWTTAVGVLQLLASPLVSRFGVKKAVGIGMWSFALGCILCVIAQSSGALMAGRVFQGIGYGVAFTSSLGYISMWLEGSSRQKCITIQATSIAIGQMVFSALSVPWYNALGSWQAVMGIDCVLGLIAAVLWSIFASNRVRSDGTQKDVQTQVAKENPLRAAFKSRAAIGLLIVIFGIMYTYNVFTSYGPTFFQTVRGLSPEMAGVMIGLLPLAGIFGVVIGGFLTTKFGTRKWVLVAVCVVMFVSGICALVFTSPVLMVVAMLLLGCFNQLKNPAGQSIGMDIPGSTPAFASAVIGLSYGIPQIFTFMIPYLVSGLNNELGLQMALMILCVPLLISLIGALFVLPETGPRAQKKLEKKAAEAAE